MDDLHKYRLNSYSDLLLWKNKLGKEKFVEYLNRIYKDLLYLKKGNYYPIEHTWTDIDIELRVKICCLFISEQYPEEYRVSNDYKYIIHK